MPFRPIAVLAMTLAMSLPASADPMPAKGPSMRPVGDARSVPAWTAFCERNAAECAVDVAQPASIKLTKENWEAISKVNRAVNASVERITDVDHHGAPDVWTLAEDGKGDAEDIQLLKRRRLVGLGLPRRAMRMTVVIDEKGEGHAVLTLVTDRGDLILDSKTGDVEHWHRTGYVFIKRESQDKVAWVSLGGAVSPDSEPMRPR